MRTDPFTDIGMFLVLADQTYLGIWRWVFLIAFYGLLFGGIAIAVSRYAAEPEQRSGHHVTLAFLRMLIGAMWFQNLFWKLPLGAVNGLHFWTKEMATNAAFAFYTPLVNDVLLPNFNLLNPFVFFVELGFAASLMLGLGVRLTGVVGVLFVANLWLGLYRHTQEWPWAYIFLAGLLGLFAVEGAGRSLGLDGWLRKRFPPATASGPSGAFVKLAT